MQTDFRPFFRGAGILSGRKQVQLCKTKMPVFRDEETPAFFVDNVDNSVGKQGIPDFINGSGAHGYQQISLPEII